MSGSKSKVSIEDLYKLMSETNENITKKIESVDKKLENLTSVFHEDITQIKNKVGELETKKSDLKKRLEALEKRNRSSNLVFYGITQEAEETQNSLIDKVLPILTEKIGVDLIRNEISNIFRLGKNKETIRPTLVTFQSQIKKRAILTNSNRLKGTRLFVSEDLTAEELQGRKLLVEHLKRARREKKTANIKKNIPIVDGVEYTGEELKQLENPEVAAYYPYPPSEARQTTPSTSVILNVEEKLESNQPGKLTGKNIEAFQEISSKPTARQLDQVKKSVAAEGRQTGCTPKEPIVLRSLTVA